MKSSLPPCAAGKRRNSFDDGSSCEPNMSPSASQPRSPRRDLKVRRATRRVGRNQRASVRGCAPAEGADGDVGLPLLFCLPVLATTLALMTGDGGQGRRMSSRAWSGQADQMGRHGRRRVLARRGQHRVGVIGHVRLRRNCVSAPGSWPSTNPACSTSSTGVGSMVARGAQRRCPPARRGPALRRSRRG
jgi:hypothetical protein